MKELIVSVAILLLPLSVQAETGWQFTTPMPHGRYGHAATLGQDGKIYVMGGIPALAFSDGRFLLPEHSGVYSNLVYDPTTDTYVYRDPVPGPNESGDILLFFDQKEAKWQRLKYVGHRGELYGLRVWKSYTELGDYMEMHPDQLRNTTFERQGNGVEIVTANDGKIWWVGGMGHFVGYGRGENVVFPYDARKDKWPKVTGKNVKNPRGGGTMREITYHIDVPFFF